MDLSEVDTKDEADEDTDGEDGWHRFPRFSLERIFRCRVSGGFI